MILQWWTVTFVFKVGAKVALNACAPGSTALVEFAEAAHSFLTGDIIGGAISTISGVGDLATLGLMSTTKEAMKESAKAALGQTAKETAKSAGKEATKKVGQEFSRQLAMGAIKGGKEAAIQTVRETAKTASKEATKRVGQHVGKEIARGAVSNAVEEAWRAATKMTAGKMSKEILFAGISSGGHEVGKTTFKALKSGIEKFISDTLKEGNKKFVFDAAKTAAAEEFKKNSYKFLTCDGFFSVVKGSINWFFR